MRKNAVERLAFELWKLYNAKALRCNVGDLAGLPPDGIEKRRKAWLAIAAHVLARERAARGPIVKVRGLVRGALDQTEDGADCATCHKGMDVPLGMEPTTFCDPCAQQIVVDVARVVLVPAKRGRR